MLDRQDWVFATLLVAEKPWVLSECQKLPQGLVSHKPTAYFSVFDLFELNELWPYYQKEVNQISLKHTTL